MKKIVSLLVFLFFAANGFSQDTLPKDSLIVLNEDISVNYSHSSLSRSQYNLFVSLKLHVENIVIKGFYFNGRKVKLIEETIDVNTSPTALHYNTFGIHTAYSVYEATHSDIPLNEHLVIKYRKNKKYFFIELPLSSLRTKIFKQ